MGATGMSVTKRGGAKVKMKANLVGGKANANGTVSQMQAVVRPSKSNPSAVTKPLAQRKVRGGTISNRSKAGKQIAGYTSGKTAKTRGGKKPSAAKK